MQREADSSPAASPRVRYRFLRGCITLFGVASLSFILGAAVIFFDLPSSSFLRNAFLGGPAFFDPQQAAQQPAKRPAAQGDPVFTIGTSDKPD